MGVPDIVLDLEGVADLDPVLDAVVVAVVDAVCDVVLVVDRVTVPVNEPVRVSEAVRLAVIEGGPDTVLEPLGVPEIVFDSVPDCVFVGLPVVERVLVGFAEEDRLAVVEGGPEPEAVMEAVVDLVAVTEMVDERDADLVGVRVFVVVRVGVTRELGVPVACCEPEPEPVPDNVAVADIVQLGVFELVFVKDGVTVGLAVLEGVPDRVTLGVSVHEGVADGVPVIAAVQEAVQELVAVMVCEPVLLIV